MHHSHAIINHASHLHRFVGNPRPNVTVQLGGSDVEAMATATKLLQDHGYAQVNINNGCPSPNVQHGKFGAVLMKTPQLVADMLTEMERRNVTIPVTVKCRTGIDHQDDFEFLQRYVDTLLTGTTRPPPHLIVHARKCILKGLSPKQNRSIPPLNYERVFDLSKAFPDLPITINGGFTTVEQIKMMLEKVDGCMIGRKGGYIRQHLMLWSTHSHTTFSHGRSSLSPRDWQIHLQAATCQNHRANHGWLSG